LGDPLSAQEAFYRRGTVRARMRNIPAAIEDFSAVYTLSVEMRKPFGIINAAVSLVWLTLEDNDVEAAEHWLRVARVTMEAGEVSARPGKHARFRQREGEVLMARHRYLDARAALVDSVEIWEQRENHREVATVLANIVTADLELGALDRAYAQGQRAAKLLRDSFGDDEPQLATAQLNLGNVLQRQGKTTHALKAYEDGLRRAERLYGPGEPATAVFVYYRGAAQVDLGRWEDAEASLRSAMVVASEDDAIWGMSRVMLGRALTDTGRVSEGRDLCAAGLVALEALLNPQDPHLLEARVEVARVKGVAGQPEAALEEASAARALLEAMNARPDVVGVALEVEADAHVAQGRSDQAGPLYRRAVALALAAQGEDSGRVARLRASLEALEEPERATARQP
jgi:tetratricopeptide (TPR) repeat protein